MSEEDSRDPVFRIDKEKIAKYREISETGIEKDEKSDPIIQTMKDVFLISAAIGLGAGRSKTLTSNQIHGPFKWHNLDDKDDIPLIQAMALATSKDLTILTSKERMRDLLEPYANWGFDELYRIVTNPGDRRVNVVEYLLRDYDEQ